MAYSRFVDSSSTHVAGDPPVELGARDIVVATWDLKRKRDWTEFKGAVQPTVLVGSGSTYTSGGDGAAFIEGFSSPREMRRTLSSFDEPIASAISGSLDSSNLPVILPMYPNGVPRSNPRSFRNSIPIRTMAGIGDGMTEGFGRLRRDF